MWIMYDAVTISNIPLNAKAVAGYVDGKFKNYDQLRARHPHAHVLSIAVFAEHDAHCLDVEPGDAHPEQAPHWVHRQHERGIEQPVVYASAGTWNSILGIMRDHGVRRENYRVWTAHYTHKPHICAPETCGEISFHADGTQWTDRAQGKSLDESLLHSHFFPRLHHKV